MWSFDFQAAILKKHTPYIIHAILGFITFIHKFYCDGYTKKNLVPSVFKLINNELLYINIQFPIQHKFIQSQNNIKNKHKISTQIIQSEKPIFTLLATETLTGIKILLQDPKHLS